jgi:hypothetical protein
MSRTASLRLVNADYQRRVGGHPNESNDCTVRALSLASGIDYKDAHVVMELAGRRPLQGSNMASGLSVAEELGMLHFQKIHLRARFFAAEATYSSNNALFTKEELLNPRAKRVPGRDVWTVGRYMCYTQPQRQITLSLLLKKLPKGRYIFCTNNHAFAVVDGVVQDGGPIGLSTRIRLCYQIVEAS